jgi:hypothetical protein
LNKDDERRFWYLNYADIPDDDEVFEAYSEAPVRPLETQEIIGQAVARQAFGDAGCKSCSEGVGGDFLAHLRAQWNAGLGIEEMRLCATCGSTALCTRLKDSPNKYKCKDPKCQ